MDRGYSENVTIDEGTDAYGTNTKLHFEGDNVIVQRTFDAQPIVEACKAERIATEGQRWGEMRKVGTLPMVIYAQALTIRENKARRKFIKDWLTQNPAFITFDRYLK